jgi:hypothetical protein
MAATVAALIAQPLAYRLQKDVTTSPHVDDVHIASITRQERGKLISHRVVTGRS